MCAILPPWLLFGPGGDEDVFNVLMASGPGELQGVGGRFGAFAEEPFDHLRLASSRRKTDSGAATGVDIHASIDKKLHRRHIAGACRLGELLLAILDIHLGESFPRFPRISGGSNSAHGKNEENRQDDDSSRHAFATMQKSFHNCSPFLVAVKAEEAGAASFSSSPGSNARTEDRIVCTILPFHV
jgi:hypothetical protein